MVRRKLSRPRRQSTGGAKPRIRGMEYVFEKKKRARSRPPLRQAGCCCYSKSGKPCGNIVSKANRNSGVVYCWRHLKSNKHPKSSCEKPHNKYERCKGQSSTPPLPPSLDIAPPLPRIKLKIPEYYKKLHTQGFVVLKNVFDIDPKERKKIEGIADKWAEVIFNPDKKRSQAPLTKPTYKKERRGNNKKHNEEVDEYNKNVEKLTTKTIPSMKITIIKQIQNKIKELFPNHIPNDMVVLRSDENCKSQPAHSDYLADDLIVKETGLFPKDHEMPLGVIVPLMDKSYIDVWPESIGTLNKDYKPIRVRMNAGDMLIFRGDTVHGGSSYSEYNIRIHTFADHPSVKRKPNTTQHADNFECIVPRRASREDKSVPSDKSHISL